MCSMWLQCITQACATCAVPAPAL
uniref:Uncharacterized protein n=1 Tax=Anguilla anguilla TaxID=7936 RepID=A0A0E9SU53_ANGAN